MRSGSNLQPRSLRIRTYQVGFGDCFLLTFTYSTIERHILIDFGSTARPPGAPTLDVIASQIREACLGKLHAVVATHRHRDHISGFATRPDGKGPGDVIASCEPDVVVQPWTESPRLAVNAIGPQMDHAAQVRAFVDTRAAMQDFAQTTLRFIATTPFTDPQQRQRLQFLGENNITNRPAVENLMRMGARHFYCYYGSKSGLEACLPGVDVHVLGPPTLEQSEAIRHQQPINRAEYWHMRAKALDLGHLRPEVTGLGIFPKAETFRSFPPQSRWLVDRLNRQRSDDVFELVRILDDHMNNTSLILLFRVGDKAILFPGDAQFENWSYALSQPAARRLLKSVYVYKVGHHGSLNGTPKSLWQLFERRSREERANRMISINSTMAGIHGFAENNTEVPRHKLVKVLTEETQYLTTQQKTESDTKAFVELNLAF